jgi:hypothetical protein
MDAFEKWRREQTRPDPTKQDAEFETGSTSYSMQLA